MREGRVIAFTIANDEDRRLCWETLYGYLAAGTFTEEELWQALERGASLASLIAKMDHEYYALRFTPIPEDALAEMKAYGHRIGAHSLTHRALQTLDDAALDAEIPAARNIWAGCTTAGFSAIPMAA